jgi:opacity protein-like surface antigen
MKKLVLVAALAAALGACSQAAEEADDTATATETPAAEDTAAATGSAGTYEYEVDGKATTSVLAADGTYEDTQDGKVIEKGTWADKDGKVCFDPEGDDAAQPCFTTTEPDADGVFTATSDDGKTVLTIKKTA